MAKLELLILTGETWPLNLSSSLGLAVLLYLFWAVYTWHRLCHVAGPLGSAFSSWWLLRSVQKGRFHYALKDVADRYGDLIRVGPNHLVSSDIDVLRRLSSSKSKYSRGGWYGTFRFMPQADHSFSILDEDIHNEYRNRVSGGYSSTHAMETKIGNQTMKLIELIRNRFISTASEHRPVEFASIAHYFAMDTIGDITFGKPFGFLDEGKDIFGYLKWNEAYYPFMMPSALFPELARLLYIWPLRNLFPADTDKVGLGRFIRAAKERVEEQYALGADKERDMMGMFFSQGVTREEAVSEAVLQVVAGTDSVATPIRMTILYLINTPTVYRKLLKELDSAADQISSPITDSEARRLPYLQAVIREALRIFPGATPLLFKKTPKGGDTVSNVQVPEGTLIGHNVFGILRSKKYWGHDADVFRPERWIEASEAELERLNTVFEVQFGSGKYKCLGRPLVFMELNKVLPELLRRFDFTVTNPSSPLKVINAGFYLMTDMWMRITERE